MNRDDLLEGKSVLIVDDEPDILETLKQLLSICEVETASSFDEARDRLVNDRFDLTILDIMGVNGYALLELATEKKITAIMLTANALSPEDTIKSHLKGAAYYLPKEELHNIRNHLRDVLKAQKEGKT